MGYTSYTSEQLEERLDEGAIRAPIVLIRAPHPYREPCRCRLKNRARPSSKKKALETVQLSLNLKFCVSFMENA